jgi:adenylate cyclase
MALEFSAPRDTGLFTPRQMIENYVFCVVGTASILFLVVFHAVREMGRAEDRAEREFQRSEQLLANILPAPIAQRLKAGEAFIADAHDDVSVLFADLAGSTALAGSIAPDDFVRFLNELFSAFDALVGRHGLEKIKITGDCYMAVGGAPSPHPDHPAAMARLALAMRDTAETIRDPLGRPAAIRIGLASGPVVTGVIGTGKLFYDVWGDAVNLASRMESTGAPGRIQVSESMRARLPRAFIVQERGMVDVKGKGLVPIWLLTGERPETAS